MKEEDSKDNIFSVVPPAPEHNPVKQAMTRAEELGEKSVAATLGYFASMPSSTGIIANPVLHHTPVDCNGTTITLDIRSFTIRGNVAESDIVNDKIGPYEVIFAGLFGETGSSETFADFVNRKFFDRLNQTAIDEVAAFVKKFPGLGPEVAMHHFLILSKAKQGRIEGQDRGLHDERDAKSLLFEMITVHMENVAIGGISAYMNSLLLKNPQFTEADLATSTMQFVKDEVERKSNAFQVSYSLILGHHANGHERLILERMGTIQIHHGSAGSNMVARYMATLHTFSVEDFLIASHMALDGARHFGAIHDMSDFVQELESLDPAQREERIREKMLTGGLPTFGHPEISAAGRGNQVQQDPRPAIYIAPVFKAIDAGQLDLTERRQERLSIARLIYLTAFVNGVLKPGREDSPPLRLTANTDFGAWCVQEALGIEEADRTLLTYIFRGFGWMMDAREQLQQKMIRPVIAPDPKIVPKSSDDPTIPDLVARVHRRLIEEDPFAPQRS